MITNKWPLWLLKTGCLRPRSTGNYIIHSQVSDYSVPVASEPKTSLKVTKKPHKPPFMKNVFLGVFDLEMLAYPELDKERLLELKRRAKPIENYFNHNIDTNSISLLKMIPNEVVNSLKNLGLFGQTVTKDLGGCDLTAVETAFISEIISKDLNIALTLYSHNFLGVQSLVMYGSQQQKKKYLPGLASGTKCAAFCMAESISGSDLLITSTRLLPSNVDSNVHILNGKKNWVINGNCADIFVVTAKVDYRMHTGKIVPCIRILLVERDSPGVTVSKPQENLGLKASNICEVHFENTPVHTDCFLGNEIQGFEMCNYILNNGRFTIGSITASLLKSLTRTVVEFITSRKQFEKPLLECELVQDKLADIANCIYILESMTYHTASILDNYDNPDCELELAIIKAFSFTEGRRCLDLLMELMGGRAFSETEIIQKYFKDFRTMEMFDGTTDIAKLFITLKGIQYAGVTMNETVSKMRFPYEYPSFVIKRWLTLRKVIQDQPKLYLKLFEELHPTLIEAAKDLEYCVHKFHFSIGVLLNRYAADTVHQQIELMRLADTAIKIYAMTTVLARSSRSYCIGLPNSESEVKYAIKICGDYKKIIRDNLNDVINGLVVTGDIFSFKFGSNVIKHHGYFLEHPLERSF